VIKVLYLPINSYDSAQTGMYDAWKEAGVSLEIFDFFVRWLDTKSADTVNSEFIQAVTKIQPDLVHMQLQLTGIIDPISIRKARLACKKNTIFINWSGDVRNNASPYIISISKEVDHTFVSSTGQIPLYQRAGCANLGYWQIGYDPKVFRPLDLPYDKLAHKLSFAGNAYPAGTFADCALRQSMLLKLKKHFGNNFALFGSGYSKEYGPTTTVLGANLNAEWNKSHCILSISNYNDISHYFSDRLIASMASGRPVISYRFPSYETYFAHGSDILIAQNVDDMISMTEYCFANPEKAKQIGMAGYKKVCCEHTYRSRIIELLNRLGLQ
jgi:glycosyltransferase involved in cell wall biosynthesis